VKIYIVDAFTNNAFSGNPAAVCLLDYPKTDDWMQRVSNELNLSETAFLFREGEHFNLRWFTPKSEVDLCGHATLASAHVLWFEQNLDNEELIFSTKSGMLTVKKNEGWIHMNFPLEIAVESKPPVELIDGIGITNFSFIGRNRFDFILEVESQSVIENLSPNFDVLKRIDSRGIIVTSKSNDPEYDFVSRCFFPRLGVDEDPVTGSAHCLLGPYWMEKLQKNTFKAIQLSSRRGVLQLEVLDKRIIISGQAVTTMIGELIV
jgi:PhzF family phenazine biosynthesis protein